MAEEENNVENLILRQLRALDAKMDKGFQQVTEAFETAYLRMAELNAKIAGLQKEVADQNQLTREVVLRLTAHDKRLADHGGRIEAMEERPEA